MGDELNWILDLTTGYFYISLDELVLSNPEVTVDKQTKIVLFYFVYVKFEWSVFYHDFVGKTEKHEFRSCMVAVVRKMEARVFNL